MSASWNKLEITAYFYRRLKNRRWGERRRAEMERLQPSRGATGVPCSPQPCPPRSAVPARLGNDRRCGRKEIFSVLVGAETKYLCVCPATFGNPAGLTPSLPRKQRRLRAAGAGTGRGDTGADSVPAGWGRTGRCHRGQGPRCRRRVLPLSACFAFVLRSRTPALPTNKAINCRASRFQGEEKAEQG